MDTEQPGPVSTDRYTKKKDAIIAAAAGILNRRGVKGMTLADALDFSNAMAALNCTAMGARGGICGVEEVRELMARAPRREHPDMQARMERAASTI